MNLTSTDELILLAYFALVLGIGIARRQSAKTGRDFLQAGRALPAWICGVAFVAVSMGAPELIAMGAWGAKYGLKAALLCSIGAIPAMIFAGLFMMPLYYGSHARSVPEFLRMRFDRKTSALNAGMFAAMTIFSNAISMCVLAGTVRALHLFDGLFYSMAWPREGIFTLSIVLPAAVVLVYVLLGGLGGAMVNQVAQFFVIVAGLLPVVLLGLRNIGGWSGLKASLAATDPGLMHASGGLLNAGANPMGIGNFGIAAGVGLVLGAGFWCVDFRVIQTAMAAKNVESARRAPLIAAIPSVFLPLLLTLPGLIAMGLPTPHTSTVVRNEGGVIFHEITIVPKAEEQGRGLVPAKVDSATGKVMHAADSHPQLDYNRATPNMLAHTLPAGLLGLGLAALLASLMSGMAGNATAFNTVFTCDLYLPFIRKDASESHLIAVGRWATLGGVLLSIAAAYALAGVGNFIGALLLVFSIVNAPLLATVLLGMFWKRATGHGAFFGLIAGTAAAILHHGLTLPIDAHGGICGGWITVLHRDPDSMAQNLHGDLWAFGASLVAAGLVSLLTKARPETELAGLVHSLTPRTVRAEIAWWKRPEALAAAILLAAVALNLFLG